MLSIIFKIWKFKLYKWGACAKICVISISKPYDWARKFKSGWMICSKIICVPFLNFQLLRVLKLRKFIQKLKISILNIGILIRQWINDATNFKQREITWKICFSRKSICTITIASTKSKMCLLVCFRKRSDTYLIVPICSRTISISWLKKADA